MIIAYSKIIQKQIRIDHIINREDKTYNTYCLIGIGSGFDTYFLLVNANNESDALYYYADSKYAFLTKIESNDLDDYLQKDRKTMMCYTESIKKHMNSIQKELMNSDYSIGNFFDTLKAIKTGINSTLKQYENRSNNRLIEWDSNGPWNDQLSYLGNYCEPHQLDELRVLELIPRSQVHWFWHKDKPLTDKPICKDDYKNLNKGNHSNFY